MDLLTYYTVMGRAAAAIPLTGEHREGDACVVRAGVGVGSSLRADRAGQRQRWLSRRVVFWKPCNDSGALGRQGPSGAVSPCPAAFSTDEF